MPDKHAVLSASSSHRWLACPPSALLCAKEKDKPSEFAMQGTDAHTLCEHKLKTALGQQSKDPVEDLTFFDEEMADCTDMYAQYVMEQLSAAKETEPKTKVTEETPAKVPKKEKTLSLEDVRAVMADKSRKGYTAEVKALLTKRGVSKLSDVDAKDYAALLAEVEVIGNAG